MFTVVWVVFGLLLLCVCFCCLICCCDSWLLRLLLLWFVTLFALFGYVVRCWFEWFEFGLLCRFVCVLAAAWFGLLALC